MYRIAEERINKQFDQHTNEGAISALLLRNSFTFEGDETIFIQHIFYRRLKKNQREGKGGGEGQKGREEAAVQRLPGFKEGGR